MFGQDISHISSKNTHYRDQWWSRCSVCFSVYLGPSRDFIVSQTSYKEVTAQSPCDSRKNINSPSLSRRSPTSMVCIHCSVINETDHARSASLRDAHIQWNDCQRCSRSLGASFIILIIAPSPTPWLRFAYRLLTGAGGISIALVLVSTCVYIRFTIPLPASAFILSFSFDDVNYTPVNGRWTFSIVVMCLTHYIGLYASPSLRSISFRSAHCACL